jgi:hypothetical protein
MKVYRAFVLIGVLCSSVIAVVAQVPKPMARELMGFLLRQDRRTVEATLGQPFTQQSTTGGEVAYAYRLPSGGDSYFVAFYTTKGHLREMELTGTDSTVSTGFFGLHLDDPAEKVAAALGKPTEVRHEDDVDVDLWDYESANYSVEISSDHKLYSIQIVDESEELPKALAGAREVREFALALRDHDLEKVLSMASGEIECSDKVHNWLQTGTARTILGNRSSDLSICLARASKAILELGPEMKGTSDEIRVWTEKGGSGFVTKFPAASPLKEVVFTNESGGWRVYEVTFRQKPTSEPSAAGSRPAGRR